MAPRTVVTAAQDIALDMGSFRESRMSPWKALAIYLVAVVAFSALASPWVFRVFQALPSHAALSWLNEVDFQAVLNHLLILSAIGGVLVLLASQRSLSLRTIGLTPSPHALSHVSTGAAVAVGSVAVVLVVGFGSDVFSWDTRKSVARIVSESAITLVAAALLALSEEFFFRGCLLGWLRQRVPRIVALISVTLFFAICHFMNGGRSPSLDEITWLSGFQMLWQYTGRLLSDWRWLPEFVMLVLVGLTLGWCFLQTSLLYMSIGMHAGWVFAGKMLFFVTRMNAGQAKWWFGYGKFLGSPISILAVAVVLVLMLWLCRRSTLSDWIELHDMQRTTS
jgi:membrane protease YdiL (CAAX protease family)